MLFLFTFKIVSLTRNQFAGNGTWVLKGRPKRSAGMKQSGGLFHRLWENPFSPSI